MMTLTYPENYALLTMEEMTYTTGGDAEGENKGSWVRTAFNIGMAALATVGIVKTAGELSGTQLTGSAISSGSITGLMATVCGLGTTVLGYLNISSIGAIAGQIQKAYPEQYPEEGTTLNGTLIRDSALVYFSSPIGALLGLANIGTAAGYVYCMLK